MQLFVPAQEQTALCWRVALHGAKMLCASGGVLVFKSQEPDKMRDYKGIVLQTVQYSKLFFRCHASTSSGCSCISSV